MFAPPIGRRATALATTLAVVIGLAITPAFTATAAEGDQPPVVAPVVEPLAPPVVPAIEDSAVAPEPTPVAELVEAPTAEGEPQAQSPIAPLRARMTAPPAGVQTTGFQSVAVPASTDIQPNSVGPLVVNYGVYIQFSYPSADRWRVAGLPAGLTFYNSGLLAGSVHVAGTYSFEVTAEDRLFPSGYDDLATKTYIVTVENAAPVIVTDVLDSAVVGVPYSEQLTASGAGPITFAVTGGLRLPLGLSLSPSGLISGTPAYDNVYYGFRNVYFGVTANNGKDSAQKILLITVAVPSPQFGNAPLATATHGVPYVQALPMSVGYGTLTYWIQSGSLPGGLALASDGIIRGVPVYDASYAATEEFTFTAWVQGATGTDAKTFTLALQVAPPTVTTTTLPDATVGSDYTGPPLEADGDGPMTWSATGLPAGLTLDAATGIISGSPDYNSAYGASATVTVTVTANNGRDSAPRELDILIKTPAPLFGAKRLPAATVGVLYDQALPLSYAFGDLEYKLAQASVLPAGLQLTADGRLYGTPDYNPTAGASKAITVAVRVDGTAGWDRKAFTFDLLTPAPTIVTATVPDGWWKQSYTQPISVTGPGVIVTVTGLPAGLVFTGTEISGSTRLTGEHELMITAFNTAGTATETVTLTVNDKPVLFNRAPARVETGTLYTVKPGFDGEGVTLSLGADAPAGMTMNRNGRIFWTPPTAGDYEFTVKATNPAGTDRQTFTVKVFDAPVLTQGELAQGVLTMPYRQQLQHDGTNVQFLVVDGELPDGMTLTRRGVLKGAAVEAGSFHFKVRAMNAVGVDRAWFTLTVLEPAMQLSAGNIIRGGSVTVSGSGYLPGDTLEFWLHSTPVLLGTVMAIDGSFTSTVVIPADTPAGPHHFEVWGAQSGSQSVPFTVALPRAAAAPQATPSQSQQLTVIPADEATTASEVEQIEEQTPAEEEADELPTLNNPVAEDETTAVVPANWTGLIAAAFVLLLAALLVWFLLWRRRRAA